MFDERLNRDNIFYLLLTWCEIACKAGPVRLLFYCWKSNVWFGKRKKNSAGTFFVPFAAMATFGAKMIFSAGELLCLDMLSPSYPHQQAAPVNCQVLSLSFSISPCPSLSISPPPPSSSVSPSLISHLDFSPSAIALVSLLGPSLLSSAQFQFPSSLLFPRRLTFTTIPSFTLAFSPRHFLNTHRNAYTDVSLLRSSSVSHSSRSG